MLPAYHARRARFALRARPYSFVPRACLAASRVRALRRWGLAAALALALATRAYAQPVAALPAADGGGVHATIVNIDGEELVIDVGKTNVSAAQTLTVYRTLEVRHPITHKLLRDRFVIGTLSVVQPGATLSVARIVGKPAHPFVIGDAAEAPTPLPNAASPALAGVDTPAHTAAPATPSAPTPSAPVTTAASDEDRDLIASWYATLGRAPEQREAIYAAFLQRHPETRFRSSLTGEITYLHAVSTAQLAATVASAAISGVQMQTLSNADEDEPIELAASVQGRTDVHALLLQVRALEDDHYQQFPMPIDARRHARVRLPSSVVQAPGFAYFVEAVDAQGKATAAVGSATAPKLVIVHTQAAPRKPITPSTRVRFSSEIVSFDRTSGRDYFLVNEGDFLYRLRLGPLYGVRMGYGTLHGQGGTVQQLDTLHLDPQPAGFTYGFLETELELHRLFGLALRATIGLGRPDTTQDERNGITGGFQVRARIGLAEGTHLVLAGELMPEIGQRAYIGLNWEAIDRFPMATEIVVTDQPVNSDELAVRLIYEIGYRFTDRLSIALRPSYQLRTIRHAGPGIGMAATFDW